MENRLPRKLAAILYADVAGYSRLTGEDEDATHRTLGEYLEFVSSTIESHGGQVMHYAGDAVLAKFEAAVDAVSSAIEIQQTIGKRNEPLPDARKLQFRIGINLGDVIEDRGDIYGEGVNVAARLEALAEAGSICVSDAIRTAIGSKLPVDFVFLGEQRVKNIEEPVRAYQVLKQGAKPSPAPVISLEPVGKPSLAVKPFENLSSDSEQDYFADGLTADIVAALVKIHGLFLVMDYSASMVEFKQATVQDLASHYGVRYILKGGVRKQGNRVRVNAELIEAATGEHLWADRFDRELQDLFAIQDEITEEIVATLDIKLLRGEGARVIRQALTNPVALERLYHGLESFYKYDLAEAQRLFEEAIDIEPGSPIGYALAALAYWWGAPAASGANRSKLVSRARELAHKALELRDTSGYPQLVLAQLHLQEREYEKALHEANEAIMDRPSCPGAYATKASVLNYLGRPLEAIELARYAIRLQPVHPSHYLSVLAAAFHSCGRYQDAVDAANTAISINRDYIDPYLMLAASNVELGRHEEAQAAVEHVLRIAPELTLERFLHSQPYQDDRYLEGLAGQLQQAGLA